MKKQFKILEMSAIFAVCLFADFAAFAGNIDATDKYSWSANSGWCNMEAASGSVTVYDDSLSGFAWNENTGWIKFGNDAGGPYNNTSSTDWGVNNDGDGNLSGYAWSATCGWINFSTAQSQVKIDTSGDFSGYAWNANTGYIHFSNAAAVTYKVTTSWTSSYTVTAASAGNGTVAPLTQSVIHGDDAAVITATPAANYHFIQWDDGNTDNPRTLTNVTADQSITASFAIDTYTVTFQTDGTVGATISGSTTQTVNAGGSCSAVTANPPINYSLINWSGTNGFTTTEDNPLTVINVLANMTITANFSSFPLSYGNLVTVNAVGIPGMDAQFSLRSRIYAEYVDPIKGKTRKAWFRGITKINGNNPSDFYKAEWTKRVVLYNRRDLSRAIRKDASTTSEWLQLNPIANLPCNLYVKTRTLNRTPILYHFDTMMITSPVVTSIESLTGGDLSGGIHKESIVVIKGKHFGKRLPKVSMEYQGNAGKVKLLRLKVHKVYKYADARGRAGRSCMDPATGESLIHVEMPTKRKLLPRRTIYEEDGIYDLIIDNRIGIATDENTGLVPILAFCYESENTAPLAQDNTVTLEPGIRKYVIDVLANDADAEADKLAISLNSSVTGSGANVKVVKGKVIYYLPRGATAPFSDSFNYIVDDGHLGTDTAQVTLSF